MKGYWLATALLFVTGASGGTALAHGAGFTIAEDAPTRVVQFEYTAGQPMTDADIRVQEEGGRLFQLGKADRHGRFAFSPDQPGTWIVEADDGEGHKLRAEVAVGGSASGASARALIIPQWALLILLVVSLLINAGLLSWRSAKKKGPRVIDTGP